MTFDFYFAGDQCEEANDEICRLNGNVLKSYINDQKSIARWIERRKNGWSGKFLIDNGAFTIHRQGGEIDIDEYIDWLNSRDEYIDYAIALDSIPGKWGQPRTLTDVLKSAQITYDNYLYMRERCIHPNKLLPVYHQGEPISYLERLLDIEGLEYMAISGSKDIKPSGRYNWFIRCFNTIKNSRNPDVRIHFLGIAKFECAEKFPIQSMDATSWIITGANGSVLTEYGVVYVGDELKTLRTMPREAEDRLKHICDRYGVDIEELGTNYKARMIFNVNYLIEKSRDTEYVGYQKLRRLF